MQKKIILAIDPFDLKPSAASVADFKNWVQIQKASVQIAYIATVSNADTSLGLIAPVEDLENRLEKYAKELPFENALPVKVLIDDSSSRAGAVQKLLDFAKKERATAIALTTHGKSSWESFVVGSFAENVLRESSYPVYFLAHAGAAKNKSDKNTVFFPTDFSDASKHIYTKFLHDTDLGAVKLILFHSVTFPMPYAEGSTVYIPQNYFKEQSEWAKNEATQWLERAKNKHVDAELVIRDSGVGFTKGSTILKAAADFHADLIVMAATSNAVGRALFGSAAYDVFKARHCPALIYGQNCK